MAGKPVLVVGDLLYDMLAKTEGGLTLGSDTFVPIRVAAGGSGANAAAWLAHSGVETHFVGRVGDDAFGGFLEDEMRRVGVAPHVARDPSLPTGKVFVLVDGAGERTMITDRGASESLSPEDLPGNVAKDLLIGGHLHLSGYTFSAGSRRRTSEKALRLARASGATVSVDPSSVALLESIGPGRLLEWTRGADLFFPNRPEGELLSGEKDPDRVVERLLSFYGAVVLKLGPEGSLYADTAGRRERVPAVPVRVADTTGAGDAFCAGFLSAWLDARPPAEALRRGAKIAGLAVERPGARP